MKKFILSAALLIAAVGAVKAQSLETTVITDWNSLNKSGFYASATAGIANDPASADRFWGINAAYNNNIASGQKLGGQMLFALNWDVAVPRVYVRSTNSAGNGLWAKLLHDQGNQNINGALTVNEGLRIGKVGDGGTQTVPVGAIAKQLNLDFTGFRDNGTSTDQIGARIAAIRYNNYLEDKAFIQKTGLVFYTNPTGYNPGTTDLVERMRIAPNGNVGIGTAAPDKLLTVNGTIHAKEVQIDLTGALADYVFKPEYKLMPLHEVEQFVKTNSHLPEMPSAAHVEENGMNLGEMQNKLLQKIEELTLYIIQQDKRIQELEQSQQNK